MDSCRMGGKFSISHQLSLEVPQLIADLTSKRKLDCKEMSDVESKAQNCYMPEQMLVVLGFTTLELSMITSWIVFERHSNIPRSLRHLTTHSMHTKKKVEAANIEWNFITANFFAALVTHTKKQHQICMKLMKIHTFSMALCAWPKSVIVGWKKESSDRATKGARRRWIGCWLKESRLTNICAFSLASSGEK